MLSERPISLFLAVLFSFILHSLVIYFLVGKWGETTKPSKVISPKYIQAKLVNLDNAVKPKPKKASKPKLQEDREEIKRHVPDALEAEKQLALDQDNEKLTASYSAYIMERIEANWNRPPSARRGMEVALIIQLVPTGQVINVTMVKSSGSEAFDRSAQQAVHKVGRFERLQQLDAQAFEKNFRKLRLVFRPDDLRL